MLAWCVRICSALVKRLLRLKVYLEIWIVTNLLEPARVVALDCFDIKLFFLYALVVAWKVLAKVYSDLVKSWRVFHSAGELSRNLIA